MAAGPLAHDIGFVPGSPSIDDPLCVADSSERWVALYTRSRHEKHVARACVGYGIRYYLPLREHHTFTSRTRTYQLPLFPSYLFACLDGVKHHALLCGGSILKVIVVESERAFLAELRQIRTALQSKVGLSLVPTLKRGQWVRAVRGPLVGLEGFITHLHRRHKRDRLVLNVSILGRGVAVDIDLADVEKSYRFADAPGNREAECPSIGACQGDP